MSLDNLKNPQLYKISYQPDNLLALISNDVVFYEYSDQKMQSTHLKVSYDLDSYGLRNPHNKNHGNVDLITLGCSQTWGVGLDHETGWSNLLAKNLNVSYINLGFPGSSIFAQVQSFFSYARKHGPPKMVAAHFPELIRLRTPVIKGEFESNNGADDFGIADLVPPRDWSSLNMPKYSKKPYLSHDVLPAEVFYYINIQSINMISSYCESNNIKFYWNTWDFYTSEFFNLILNEPQLKTIIKNYIPQDPEKDEKRCTNDEHLKLESLYKDTFHMAADGSHMGVHANMHLSQVFVEVFSD